MSRKYYVIVSILLITLQTIGQQNLMDNYGRSNLFTVGYPKLKKCKSMGIKCNSTLKQALERKVERWGFDMELNYEAFGLPNGSAIKITTNGIIQNDYCKEIQTDYNNNKLVSKHVYSIGILELQDNLKRKIDWLDINPALGDDADYSKFTKLKTLSAQNIDGNEFYISPENFQTAALRLEYPGTPFFWEQLVDLKNLQSLQFDIGFNHSQSGNSGNLYNLVPPESDLFELKHLTTIQLGEQLFLPVCFNDYRKIEYLSVKRISTPELINLAIVMYSLGKDTAMNGNWTTFLSNADINNLPIIRENGDYTSFYKNGNKLCSGSFKNGTPDGNWEFWYENGKLCQQREYISGKCNGTWLFFSPHSQLSGQADTLLKLVFNNGQLTQLKTIQFENVGYSQSDCNSMEFAREVEQRIEYNIIKKSEKDIEINKTLVSINIDPRFPTDFGDTLKGHTEHWLYSNDGWVYHFEEYCAGTNASLIREKRGKPGTSSSYSFVQQAITQNEKKMEIRWIIDIENCFLEYAEYAYKATEGLPERVFYEKKELSDSNWSCKQ